MKLGQGAVLWKTANDQKARSELGAHELDSFVDD